MADTSPPLTEEDRRKREEQAHHESVKRQPFYALLAALIVALLLLVIHSSTAGDKVFVLFAVELVLGLAALLGAGLLGFLFGIPRTAKPAIGAPTTGGGAYEPNNNLEQVSDWLTKILVGAGLVELDDLKGSLSDIGASIARAVDGGTATSAVAQLIIVVFSVVGFLGAFFWTRIYYGGIQVHADQNILSLLTRSLRQETEKAAVEASRAEEQTNLVTRLLKPVSEFKGTSIPPAIRAKIDQFRAAPREWEADPVRQFFGPSVVSASGLTLRGTLEKIVDDENAILTLTVEGSEARPLQGEVVFLLHPTYLLSVRTEQARNNRASVTISAESWYHAAAIVGDTVLVIDLRTIEGVPDWFKAE
jgi:hypothetical protein